MTVNLPIVVGVVDHDIAILDYAAREAVQARCRLRLARAYAVPPAPPAAMAGVDIAASYEAGAQEVLDDAVRYLDQNFRGLAVETVLTRGHTPDVLEQLAHEARMLVIGPAARKPWYVRLFEGEVTQRLVQHAACPVVVVPDGWQAGDGVGPVVVVIDDETTQGPLQFAQETAACRGSGVQVLPLTDSSGADGVQVAEGASLLVLPRPGEHRLTHFLSDPSTQDMVRDAQCPVAVVPADYRS